MTKLEIKLTEMTVLSLLIQPETEQVFNSFPVSILMPSWIKSQWLTSKLWPQLRRIRSCRWGPTPSPSRPAPGDPAIQASSAWRAATSQQATCVDPVLPASMETDAPAVPQVEWRRSLLRIVLRVIYVCIIWQKFTRVFLWIYWNLILFILCF